VRAGPPARARRGQRRAAERSGDLLGQVLGEIADAPAGVAASGQDANPGSDLVPGLCRGKAHRYENLGYAGRRVLVSRKWSGKTLTDHRADRKAWLMAMPDLPAAESTKYKWERVTSADPDHMPPVQRLMHVLADRADWKTALAEARRRAEDQDANLRVVGGRHDTALSPPYGQEARMLSLTELCEWLNITERHARKLVERDAIPYRKIGHLLRFAEQEIEQWSRPAPRHSARSIEHSHTSVSAKPHRSRRSRCFPSR
jgi:excisionase family DNA binding protein